LGAIGFENGFFLTNFKSCEILDLKVSQSRIEENQPMQ